ncbi:Cofactor of BRCA1 [Actinomortierella ambigua]|uniref:Cofactor of BRCA1 n=1 Tax=Actinomortierella ambigua TaxID=1343610 RepID=A0A9P6UCB4_9FUNG|nr:Cofactor of BRCA1 [Actinomortierella ambigua]
MDNVLLGPRAGEKIRDMLVKQKPGQAIVQIQERCGLNLPDIQAIYPLLDHHGRSRYDVHSSCMKALKAKLLQKLETAPIDEARFDSILRSMLPYIEVDGLQDLPLTLLGRFPDRMSDSIIDKIAESDDLFRAAPQEVKRRIWLAHPSKFRDDVIPIVKAYRTDPTIIRMAKDMSIEQPAKVITQRRAHPSIRQLMDIVGGNLNLYNHIGTYLRSLFIQTNDAVYCTLRFDLLMAMHEANLGSITKVDPCHELVWNLDACNRTLSMDDRRVENIRKFFDKVARDDPVHGDIAMILNDPFTSNMITSRLLTQLNDTSQKGKVPNSDTSLIWTATTLNLGAHARRIIQQQKFRIPRVEALVTDKFFTTLSNCILDDTLGQLKQEVDESSSADEVHFTEDNLAALDDSEVARKLLSHYILNRLHNTDIHALTRTLPIILTSLRRNKHYDPQSMTLDSLRVTYQSFFHSFLTILSRQQHLHRFMVQRKFQAPILNDFLLPAAGEDAIIHEQLLDFFADAFSLVASSGRAGNIADSFIHLGRWLETLYTTRPIRQLNEERVNVLREKYCKILRDATWMSGGRFRVNPEDARSVHDFVKTSVHGSAKVTFTNDNLEFTGHDGIELKKLSNRELKGHIQYVNTVRFFPSGQVILSGGGDFMLKVWSVLDGTCPVTMKGHIKPITDTAIIDRGRNIVSSSSDGGVRLWEVASGSTIRTLGSYDSKVNALALDEWQTPVTPKSEPDMREFGTDGKLVIAACEDGALHGIDVRATEEVILRSSYNKAPVRACAYSAREHLIAFGTSEGVVEVFDLRQQDQIVSRHQRATAGISSLAFGPLGDKNDGSHLFIGTDDSGLYETTAAKKDSISVVREYVGFDLDGPCRARVVGHGPGVLYGTKEGGLLRLAASAVTSVVAN